MFDSKAELLEKIRLGEDSLLELRAVRFAGEKVRGPARDDLADELAAFANAREGVLLLGVDDKTRQIEGIPLDKLDIAESLVREICNDTIKPPLRVTIIRMNLPDHEGVERPVIKVDVLKSLFVHQSPGGYFYRVGSSKRLMNPEYHARLIQQRSQTRIIRFDEQVVASATLDDLDPVLLGTFPHGKDTRRPRGISIKARYGEARRGLGLEAYGSRNSDGNARSSPVSSERVYSSSGLCGLDGCTQECKASPTSSMQKTSRGLSTIRSRRLAGL